MIPSSTSHAAFYSEMDNLLYQELPHAVRGFLIGLLVISIMRMAIKVCPSQFSDSTIVLAGTISNLCYILGGALHFMVVYAILKHWFPNQPWGLLLGLLYPTMARWPIRVLHPLATIQEMWKNRPTLRVEKRTKEDPNLTKDGREKPHQDPDSPEDEEEDPESGKPES